MAKRIGEALLEKGVITAEQLRTALNLQLMHGGHLGTCLIQLNYVDEETLGQSLADVLGVAHADSAAFQSIPSNVIASIPRRLVERHRVIPLRLEDKLLDVAMVNPNDLLAIDDLTFATGAHMLTSVAPEVRIIHAMEQYYGIPRSRRFILLSPKKDHESSSNPQTLPRAASRRDDETQNDSPPPVSVPAANPLAASEQLSAEDPLPPQMMLSGDHTDLWDELIGRPEGGVADRPPHPRTRRVDERDLRFHHELKQVAGSLCRAETPEDIATMVLDFAMHGLKRCILLMVEKLEARVWDWRGAGLAPHAPSSITFPIASESVFELLDGADAYLGPIADEPHYHGFFRDLDITVPAEVLILPIYLHDQLVAVLYGDGGEDGAIRGDTDDYRRLVKKIEVALVMLSLKRNLQEI